MPCPGNTIRIVDPLTGAVLPRGQSGEIAVKGPTLMLGYLRVPPENVFDEDGFFHSGDGGFVDDQGRLHWHGRLNDIIKTGGANVSPLEVDAVLASCPGVKIAATVGVRPIPWASWWSRVSCPSPALRSRRLRSVPSLPRVSRATRFRAA